MPETWGKLERQHPAELPRCLQKGGTPKVSGCSRVGTVSAALQSGDSAERLLWINQQSSPTWLRVGTDLRCSVQREWKQKFLVGRLETCCTQWVGEKDSVTPAESNALCCCRDTRTHVLPGQASLCRRKAGKRKQHSHRETKKPLCKA